MDRPELEEGETDFARPNEVVGTSQTAFKQAYDPEFPIDENGGENHEEDPDESKSGDGAGTENAKFSTEGVGSVHAQSIQVENEKDQSIKLNDDNQDQTYPKAVGSNMMEEEALTNTPSLNTATMAVGQADLGAKINEQNAGISESGSNYNSNLATDQSSRNKEMSDLSQNRNLDVRDDAGNQQQYTGQEQRNNRSGDKSYQLSGNQGAGDKDQIRREDIEAYGGGMSSTASFQNTQSGTHSTSNLGGQVGGQQQPPTTTFEKPRSSNTQPVEAQKQTSSSIPMVDPMLAMMQQMMKAREEAPEGQSDQNRGDNMNVYLEMCKFQTTMIENMKKQIEFKDQQLEFKEKQIAELKKEYKKLQRSRSRSKSRNKKGKRRSSSSSSDSRSSRDSRSSSGDSHRRRSRNKKKSKTVKSKGQSSRKRDSPNKSPDRKIEQERLKNSKNMGMRSSRSRSASREKKRMIEERPPIGKEVYGYQNDPMMKPGLGHDVARGMQPDFNRGFEMNKDMDMGRPRPFSFSMNAPPNFPNAMGPANNFIPPTHNMAPVRGFPESFPPNDRMNPPNMGHPNMGPQNMGPQNMVSPSLGPSVAGPLDRYTPIKNEPQFSSGRKDDSPKRKAASPKQRSPSPGSDEDFTNMRPREIAIYLQKKKEAKMAAGGSDSMKNQRWGADRHDDHHGRNLRDKDDGYFRGRGGNRPGSPDREMHGMMGKPNDPQQFSTMEDYFKDDSFGRGHQNRRMPMNQNPNAGIRQPMNPSQLPIHPKGDDAMGGGFGPSGGMPNQMNPGMQMLPNNSGGAGYYQERGSQYPYMSNNMGYNQNAGPGNPNMGPGHFRFQAGGGRPEPPVDMSMRKMGPGGMEQNPPFFGNYFGGNPEPAGNSNRGISSGGGPGPVRSTSRDAPESYGQSNQSRGGGGGPGSFSMRKENSVGSNSNAPIKSSDGYFQNKPQGSDIKEFGGTSSQKKSDMHIEEKRDSDEDPSDRLEEGEMADNPLLKQKLMEMFLKNPGDKRLQKIVERAKGE
eukprot:CAMPEP_0176438498 /NCGR_PEP_ID=MMETSP0127-20121128/19321_1 /TAXON_ID=938130 /ORGANISM="Platyophrya macrostoma, Strain WH" /LENGTH=1012 /DNA_ID=CAMNT_0017822463 /DNA_START=33 /DNA_END=3071 /DNA_ORIENTATION=-